MECPKCKSVNVKKAGFKVLRLGTKVQQHQCNTCGHWWHEVDPVEEKSFVVGKCSICYKEVLNIKSGYDGENQICHESCLDRAVKKETEIIKADTVEDSKTVKAITDSLQTNYFEWLKSKGVTKEQYDLLDKKKQESYAAMFWQR